MSNLDLTRMWGASTRIGFDSTGVNVFKPFQVADVRLPEACVCSLYFQAEVSSPPNVPGIVTALNLDLSIGLGLTSTRRTLTFGGVPVIGAPLEITIPYIPAATILATVSGFANAGNPGDVFELLITVQVSPLARMPVNAEPLKFGMALPGEADGLDDELREDLEEQHPEAAELMRARAAGGQHPLEEEEDDDDQEEDEPRVFRVPPHLEHTLKRLERKLGRTVTVRDLPPAARRQIVRMLQHRGAR